MGQFSVTIYGAAGSILSDIQHPVKGLMWFGLHAHPANGWCIGKSPPHDK